jgi:hypothetical protein
MGRLFESQPNPANEFEELIEVRKGMFLEEWRGDRFMLVQN